MCCIDLHSIPYLLYPYEQNVYIPTHLGSSNSELNDFLTNILKSLSFEMFFVSTHMATRVGTGVTH